MVKGLLVRLLIAVAAGAVIAAPASAAGLTRCGSPADGFLLANEHYEVIGPFGVAMSHATAASIARRVGPGEFGTHETAAEVPCAVAVDIAMDAANAWLHWGSNHGTARVHWYGYATGPYLGVFRCTGVRLAHARVRETCHHAADGHAGAITGQFVIGRNPYNP
jgi:hypothetical protein